MAMTACAAKVLSKAICLSVNGRTSKRRIKMTPNATLPCSSGTASAVLTPSRLIAARASGNSLAAMARASVTCTILRVRMARPARYPDLIGRVSPRSSTDGPCRDTCRITSPSTRCNETCPASQRRNALRTIVSKISCKSPRERAMTRSTSAVAFSRACASSRSRRSCAASLFAAAGGRCTRVAAVAALRRVFATLRRLDLIARPGVRH